MIWRDWRYQHGAGHIDATQAAEDQKTYILSPEQEKTREANRRYQERVARGPHYSECCGRRMPMWPESDICPECKEHCDTYTEGASESNPTQKGEG